MDEGAIRATLHDGTASAVLQACIGQPRGAKSIAFELNMPAVTVYRHVRRLVDARLLVVERCAVTPSGKPYDMYRATIEWAGILLTSEGIQVRWQRRGRASDRLHGLFTQLEKRK